MDDHGREGALSPEELTRILYTHLLGRPPELAAMMHLPRLIRERGDVGFAIKQIVESEEFRMRNPLEALATTAYARLGRKPRVVDVGAQTLGPGSHVYDALLHFCHVEITGFDPLGDRLAERAETEAQDDMTLIPCALGDGNRHTLHINNHDATSSFYPLNEEGNKPFRLLAQLHTVGTQGFETKRLDDVIAHDQVDFLKLDIQGAELLVLENAAKVLERTAVVHCEVEFSPIYRGQPLFGDVAAYLLKQGFYFLDFSTLGHYAHDNASGFEGNDRLMWADAVFLRESNAPEIRTAQALMAAIIYRKPALSAHLLGL